MVGRIGAIGRMMGRVGAASPVKGVPDGFAIIVNDDGSYEVDDDGLIYIEETA